MRLIKLYGTKIYFEGHWNIFQIYVKYILAKTYLTFKKKIYAKYILDIQLFAKIYFEYFDIYVTYIFFRVGGGGNSASIMNCHSITNLSLVL